MSTQPSIESLRDDLHTITYPQETVPHTWTPFGLGKIANISAALTELERLRAGACRWYNADGTFSLFDPEEVIQRRKEAAKELDALRAELAAEKAKRDGAEKDLAMEKAVSEQLRVFRRMDGETMQASLERVAAREVAERTRADAAEARNAELGARVVALEDATRQFIEDKPLAYEGDRAAAAGEGPGPINWAWFHPKFKAFEAVLSSTPTADLAAHDAKVREPLEKRIAELESQENGYIACLVSRVEALDALVNDARPYGTIGDRYRALPVTPSGYLEQHDARIRREEREAAAKKCAEAYWAMVAPKDHAAMHPTIEFWRDALGLEPMSSAEHEALAAIEPRHPEIVMVDDLAMLVRLLVHSIRKHSPDNETARKAMDYLRRHELQGSPLRTTILSPAPDAASVQPSASPLPERNTQRPQAGLEEDGDE